MKCRICGGRKFTKTKGFFGILWFWIFTCKKCGMKWMLMILILLWAGICEAQPSCQLAVVEWKDAVAYTRVPLIDPDEMTANVISIGCIVQTEKTILIVTSLTDGKPDIFLVIPKGWVTKITNLVVENPDGK